MHKEAPEKKAKKSNAIWYALGALVVIIVIVVLIRSANNAAPEVQTPEVKETPKTAPKTVTSAEETKAEDKPAAEITGPSMENLDCAEDVTTGIMPGSCNKLANGDIEFSIKNSGRGNLEGVWYYFQDGDKNVIGEGSVSGSIAVGEVKQLTAETSKLSGVKYIQITPVASVDGKNRICANKKNTLPMTSCS